MNLRYHSTAAEVNDLKQKAKVCKVTKRKLLESYYSAVLLMASRLETLSNGVCFPKQRIDGIKSRMH
jgi:hypothetical protein